MKRETKAQRRAVEEEADHCMKHPAKVERIGNRVVAIHGYDAETLCVCSHPADAEVIARLFTDLRNGTHR